MNIGLFFGSFNPVHVGHLIIANYMLHFGRLDKIWLVISPQNPFKSPLELLPQEQRLDMVQLALENQPDMEASDVEFSLPTPSFTAKTLRHLRKQYPKDNFKVIMGSDNLATFEKWEAYEEILEHHQLLVYYRFGHKNDKLENHPNVLVYDAPVLHISATYVRDLIQQKAPISFLVPKNVEGYIKEHNCFEGISSK